MIDQELDYYEIQELGQEPVKEQMEISIHALNGSLGVGHRE